MSLIDRSIAVEISTCSVPVRSVSDMRVVPQPIEKIGGIKQATK